MHALIVPDLQFALWPLLIVAAVLACLPLLSMWARARPTLGVRLKYGWGWVYVFQDTANPCLLKIGMTHRACSTRMREVSIDMTGGRDLRRIYAVNIPYVEAVETVAHRRAARFHDRSDRGIEWFRVRRPEDVGRIVRAVEKAAFDIRKLARRRRKWSEEADETASYQCGRERQRLFK